MSTSPGRSVFEPLEPRLLLSANLPGLHLVDPTVDHFDGQVVYLDFDGAEDVDYRGPVEVNGIDVPAFSAPGDLAGQEQAIVAQALDQLRATFADTGLLFTSERPDTTQPFSTVYVGGDDAAFAAYGGFVSIAEQVDVANGNLSDEALVFSDQVGYDGTRGDYVLNLTESIAHESGHLLGYAHDVEYGAGGVLSEVAAASGYIVSVTQPTYVGGQSSSVTVRVKNTSSRQDFIIDYGSKPSGWGISPGSYNPYIDANAYYNANFTVTPPTAGGSGTIVWQFKEDGLLSNPILDTYNDGVSAAASKPDLIVQDISVSSPRVAGQAATITATLKNQGNADANGSIELKYYVDGGYIGYDNLSWGLDAGDSDTESISYTAPTSGSHSVRVYVDSSYKISESNESNNSRTESFTWSSPPKPDLIIQDISISPSSPTATQSATITATLKNQGDANASGSIRLKYYVDGSYIGDDYLSLGLGAGSSNDESISYTASSAGNHTVKVVIDTENIVSESNEGNNDRSETYYWNPPPKPDLIAYGLSVSDTTVNPGQSITVNWTAKNQGQASAGSTQQGVVWSTDSSISRSDTLLEREYLGSMGVNVMSPEAHTITIPTNATPGQTYYIGVYADYDLTESESDENNNASSAIAVTINQSDLIVTDVLMNGQTSLPSVRAGDGVSLDFDILNQGSAPTIADVHMRWYWGTSSGSTANYIAEGSLGTINGLAPGESERETDASWTIPSLAAGTYWLTGVIDWDGRVPESNEGNNARSESFTVLEPLRPDLIVQDIKVEGQTDISSVTIYPGDAVTIDALSKNVGTASSNSSVPYRWWWGYSSGDKHQQITDGNGNDVGGTIAEVNGLQVNEDEWVSEVIIGGVDPDNWVVNLAPGTYWLTFEIDSPNDNAELEEGNNLLSEQFVVTQSNRAPSTPGNPVASEVTVTSALVSWDPSTDPDGDPVTYTIQWKGDLVITWLGAPTGTTANTYYDVTGLDPESVYDVRVKASDGSLDSDWNDQENVITTVRPTDGKFMAITPWQFVKGEPLPVVLAYKDYPDAYLPNINYATVEIGPKDGPQKAVDLYSATGSNLGVGGHSIEFGDGGSDYYEICNDADWWYTVGYIRPEDYNDSQYWPGGSLRTEVTMTWKPWALSFEETATATSAVQLINDWPSWEGWYAGDTHFHSALTDTLVLDSVYSMEYGSPLEIARLLGESMELDWLSLTDHSYDLDDDQEPFLELWTPNDPDVYMPMENYRATPSTWQWENFELDPAFSSGTLRFLKGEEISVGAWHDVAPTTLYPQLHMLAYGFDPTDPFVEAFGGWGRKDLSEVMTEVVALGSSGGTVFTYAAHPSASSDILADYRWDLLSAYAEPWLASDVTAALAFTDDDGELLFRGFEFWNGRQDDGRDASLGLWEEVLAEHPDNHHWYLAGGSDDHLSHYLAGTTALGDVRTVVAAQSNSQDDILDAYYNGRSIVTDGPWFTMGIDVNDDGDLMDFGVDGMLGEEFVVTAPELGVLEFDWPNQSGTPWEDSSGGTIALVQYGSNGTKRVHGVSGGQFDAYAEYETATGEFATGWQGYRAELDLNGYEAYTNPIWLYFDVNQPPTDIALSNNSVAENQPSGTVIGVLSGTDPDAGQSATLVFTLVPGYGDNSQFSIDAATKQLKTAAVFDYETQNSYNIKVRATDNGNPALSYDETFAITVTDIDDVAPAVTAAAINDGLAQRSKIASLAFQFSEDVSAGGVGALRLRNGTTGFDMDLSAAVLSGNGTAALTWDLSGVALDDGRYTGTLAATNVTDAAGNPMAEDYIFTFHCLKCDANGDAKVDGGDLALWQQHYDPLAQNPNTPGMGDWNGDGKVDGGDLALWQHRYNPLGLAAPMKAGATSAVTEAEPISAVQAISQVEQVAGVVEDQAESGSSGSSGLEIIDSGFATGYAATVDLLAFLTDTGQESPATLASSQEGNPVPSATDVAKVPTLLQGAADPEVAVKGDSDEHAPMVAPGAAEESEGNDAELASLDDLLAGVLSLPELEVVQGL